MKKLFPCLIVIVIILSGCSSSNKVVPDGAISKRKYNKGYFLSALGKKKQELKQVALKPETASLNKVIPNPNPATSQEITTAGTIEVNEDELIAATGNRQIAAPYSKPPTTFIPFKKHIEKARYHSPQPPDDPPKKIPGLGIASFLLGVVGVIFFFVSIVWIAAFGFLISEILAIIFGAIANRKIRKNPDTYKGKVFGLIGLILGIVTLSLFILGGAFYEGTLQ